jgi:hypothetical protein
MACHVTYRRVSPIEKGTGAMAVLALLVRRGAIAVNYIIRKALAVRSGLFA